MASTHETGRDPSGSDDHDAEAILDRARRTLEEAIRATLPPDEADAASRRGRRRRGQAVADVPAGTRPDPWESAPEQATADPGEPAGDESAEPVTAAAGQGGPPAEQRPAGADRPDTVTAAAGAEAPTPPPPPPPPAPPFDPSPVGEPAERPAASLDLAHARAEAGANGTRAPGDPPVGPPLPGKVAASGQPPEPTDRARSEPSDDQVAADLRFAAFWSQSLPEAEAVDLRALLLTAADRLVSGNQAAPEQPTWMVDAALVEAARIVRDAEQHAAKLRHDTAEALAEVLDALHQVSVAQSRLGHGLESLGRPQGQASHPSAGPLPAGAAPAAAAAASGEVGRERPAPALEEQAAAPTGPTDAG